jgi:hypothetical protein
MGTNFFILAEPRTPAPSLPAGAELVTAISVFYATVESNVCIFSAMCQVTARLAVGVRLRNEKRTGFTIFTIGSK